MSDDDIGLYPVRIGRVSLEGFTTEELMRELLIRDNYQVVRTFDDGKISIDFNTVITMMPTSKLVNELASREGVEMYDVDGDFYLRKNGGGYNVRLYKSKLIVVVD